MTKQAMAELVAEIERLGYLQRTTDPAGRRATIITFTGQGRAFDGRAAIPGGALVLCADGQIVGVEPGLAAVPDGWPVADYPGSTVLPGMVDCQVHLCGDSRDGALDRLAGYSEEDLDRVIEAALRAQLAAGVTTVRDLGDRRWAVLSWRDRVAARPASPARLLWRPGRRSPPGRSLLVHGRRDQPPWYAPRRDTRTCRPSANAAARRGNG